LVIVTCHYQMVIHCRRRRHHHHHHLSLKP
jgi:hypothetical protein